MSTSSEISIWFYEQLLWVSVLVEVEVVVGGGAGAEQGEQEGEEVKVEEV